MCIKIKVHLQCDRDGKKRDKAQITVFFIINHDDEPVSLDNAAIQLIHNSNSMNLRLIQTED